jgi:hypothetical protein
MGVVEQATQAPALPPAWVPAAPAAPEPGQDDDANLEALMAQQLPTWNRAGAR